MEINCFHFVLKLSILPLTGETFKRFSRLENDYCIISYVSLQLLLGVLISSTVQTFKHHQRHPDHKSDWIGDSCDILL